MPINIPALPYTLASLSGQQSLSKIDDDLTTLRNALTGVALKDTDRTLVQTTLTNATGGGLVAGDVVGLSTAADASVVLLDTLSTPGVLVVALATINSAVTGQFALMGVTAVFCTGAVTRGHWLIKSATTKALEDSGVALPTAAPPGAVAVALVSGSGAALSAYVFGGPLAGSTSDFTPTFTSAATAFTLSSITTLAHGLGAVPPLVRVVLRNVTTEGGYVTGDEIDIVGTVSEQNAADRSAQFSVDATNITIAVGASWQPFGKATGTGFSVTAANWRLVARAWL